MQPNQLTAGATIVFPGDDAGTLLFTLMHRAGLLATIPANETTKWDTWGLEQEDGSIVATVVEAAELRRLYEASI